MTNEQLFDRVVELCGLSALLAPGVVQRALSDVGSARNRALPSDYRLALPKIRARMAVYLSLEEITQRMPDLEALISK